MPQFADVKTHADAAVRAALAAASPREALRNHWSSPSRPVKLLACGKAAAEMAREARLLEARIGAGVVTCPPEHAEAPGLAGLPVFPCDHPYPTERNVAAARAAAALVRGVGRAETLVALISGGASAHLALPAEGLTVDDLRETTRLLELDGAGIRELNTVRKHIERLKGGRLAALCRGTIEAYILSDVMGDPLDVIASGPTAPDASTFADALGVLEARGLGARLPRVAEYLRRGVTGAVSETPKPGDLCFARVSNRVIASNRRVVEAVRDHLTSLGFHLAGVEHGVEGEAAGVAGTLVRRATDLADAPRPWAWVIGGEWTVTVGEHAGTGGPSQELALAAARALHEQRMAQAAVLAFSTDGVDGPTDAAGATVTGETWGAALKAGLDPAGRLARHDSHSVLGGCGALIRTGPTGTNLNHVAALLVY